MKDNIIKQVCEVDADFKGTPDMWFLDEPRDVTGRELDARDFQLGKLYQGPTPVLVPVGQAGRETAFSFGAFDMPVVSSDVWAIIKRIAPRDVQAFPVTVPNAKRSFFIVNVIASVDCLDEKRSEITRWQQKDNRPDRLGQIHVISTLYVDPARSGDHHIFRLKDWHLALLVSGTLKTALEGIADLGVIFRPAN